MVCGNIINNKIRYKSNLNNQVINISDVRFQLQNTFKLVIEGSMKNPTWCCVGYVSDMSTLLILKNECNIETNSVG